MKKIYLLLAVFVALSSQAQKSKRDEGVKIGIKGGLNIANVYGDINNNAIRTSIHAGLAAEFVVSDKFSIQPELLFSGQGYTDTGATSYSRKKFNYINLPILAKFYVLNESLSLEAGPQIGFLVSAKNTTNTTNFNVSGQNAVEFGLNAGLGYELKNHVFFQGRYNIGVSKINKTTAASNLSYANSVIQLSVGYFF